MVNLIMFCWGENSRDIYFLEIDLLFIYILLLSWKKFILNIKISIFFSDFDSKEDVINAILGSSFVPLFSGFFPPK